MVKGIKILHKALFLVWMSTILITGCSELPTPQDSTQPAPIEEEPEPIQVEAERPEEIRPALWHDSKDLYLKTIADIESLEKGLTDLDLFLRYSHAYDRWSTTVDSLGFDRTSAETSLINAVLNFAESASDYRFKIKGLETDNTWQDLSTLKKNYEHNKTILEDYFYDMKDKHDRTPQPSPYEYERLHFYFSPRN